MKCFLDTVFVQALLDKNDQQHEWAERLLPDVRKANRIRTSEAIFNEVGAAISSTN
jgi:predicted nucleic acid-binding protein